MLEYLTSDTHTHTESHTPGAVIPQTCVVSVVLFAPSAAQTLAAAHEHMEYGLQVRSGHEAVRSLYFT